MKISAIAAVGENRELGAKNKLLWHIPGELKRFKEITTGHPIIMGRKTYESIGKVLPNRPNIIITRDANFKGEGAIVVHSLQGAIDISSTYHVSSSMYENEVFIIGGGQIFTEAMPIMQRLYLTIVHSSFPQADVFFPDYSQFVKVISKEDHETGEYRYTFLTLEK